MVSMTCSSADNLSVIMTPSIVYLLTTSMAHTSGGGWVCALLYRYLELRWPNPMIWLIEFKIVSHSPIIHMLNFTLSGVWVNTCYKQVNAVTYLNSLLSELMVCRSEEFNTWDETPVQWKTLNNACQYSSDGWVVSCNFGAVWVAIK